jgi:hypothetical protein
MTLFHARSTWVHPAPPITGPAMVPFSRIDTMAIHYPAGNTPDGDPTDRPDVAGYLRSIQSDYVRTRGYSIGYSFAIDWTGDVWECRGWDIRPAANAGHNDHTVALLMLVDQDQPATHEQLVTARHYVAELTRRAGHPIVVTGHGQLPGAATACPGIGLRGQIAAGLFNPIPTPPPQEVPEVQTARRVRIRGYANVWLIGAGPALHLTPELSDEYADIKLVVVAYHEQFTASVLHQSGLEPDDLKMIPEAVR